MPEMAKAAPAAVAVGIATFWYRRQYRGANTSILARVVFPASLSLVVGEMFKAMA